MQGGNSTKISFPSSSAEGGKDIFLSSFYLAPIGYYAALFQADSAKIEIGENYRKQSYRNRCVIAGANGAMPLSIPIEKPETPKCPTKDIRIADHGNWRHLHWNAIVSAYNSSPFFDYYRDDFEPFYEKKYDFLCDFNEQLQGLVCRLLGVETPVSYTIAYEETPAPRVIDLRETFHAKREPEYETPVYYQVFSEKFGFIPNLSVIDLLFNTGNEARLVLAGVEKLVI
ncbi:MAG: WbqC family protein [Dysgonamonadaceae bacterium]|jgi:hypothetical protein|nr:WbqC family protein [Dysgonamonadaceae bacterium]